MVQFYPWFKFSFLLFLGMVMYDNNMIMSLKQKKRKFEQRINFSYQHVHRIQRYAGYTWVYRVYREINSILLLHEGYITVFSGLCSLQRKRS